MRGAGNVPRPGTAHRKGHCVSGRECRPSEGGINASSAWRSERPKAGHKGPGEGPGCWPARPASLVCLRQQDTPALALKRPQGEWGEDCPAALQWQMCRERLHVLPLSPSQKWRPWGGADDVPCAWPPWRLHPGESAVPLLWPRSLQRRGRQRGAAPAASGEGQAQEVACSQDACP